MPHSKQMLLNVQLGMDTCHEKVVAWLHHMQLLRALRWGSLGLWPRPQLLVVQHSHSITLAHLHLQDTSPEFELAWQCVYIHENILKVPSAAQSSLDEVFCVAGLLLSLGVVHISHALYSPRHVKPLFDYCAFEFPPTLHRDLQFGHA